MSIVKSDIVQSVAGRDQGIIYFVVDVDENFLYLADGKKHHINEPKKKKNKHVRFLSASHCNVGEKIRRGEGITDSELRKAIAAIRGSNQNQEE